ncbi:hypothetical protein [Luteolibacter sp. Populi]|uniref:hypothetical protein n=1 Tax=Luteolibacter sp. Populi TaxID=3230487 RepID=UPI0034656EB5
MEPRFRRPSGAGSRGGGRDKLIARSAFVGQMPAVMVVFEFKFSEEMILEMYRKYHGTRKLARFETPVRWIASVMLVVLAGLLWFLESYLVAVVMVIVLVLFLSARRIDRWLLKRRLRKSPHLNDELRICLSEEGFSTRGSKSSGELQWAVFTEARLLEDGILLFEGPQVFRFLPFHTITRGRAGEAEELVRTYVKESKVFAHR